MSQRLDLVEAVLGLEGRTPAGGQIPLGLTGLRGHR
jgi:hypothetical protein